MSNCLEVLYVCDDTGSVQCLDPRIGTTFVNYRGSSGVQHGCVDVINGSYVIVAEKAKPLLHVWPLNSQETLPGPKLVLPGRASALACSNDGLHCVVAIDTKLYVYQTSSGALLGVLSKHYRGVSKILFLADSCHFVSCGENGAVLVWRLATAVSMEGPTIVDTSTVHEPIYSFSHHALRVTDAYASPTGMDGRLYTSSIDQTVKVYDLRYGTLLLSIIFDESITAIRPNVIETVLFTGTSKGEVIEFKMDPLPRTLDYSVRDVDIPARLKGHEKSITFLAVSLDSYLLVTGGADSKVLVWDLSSRQQLRVFDMKGAVTGLLMSLANDNIFNDTFVPRVVVRNFQRVSSASNAFEVSVLMNDTLIPIDYRETSKINIIQQNTEGNTDELDRLRRALAEATQKNKELYKFAMEKILKNPYAFNDNGNHTAKRKKPRTNINEQIESL